MANISEELVTLLYERELTITTAESCTGGMIASKLVDVPGVSNVLNEAYITYSEESKTRLLGVSEEILASYGVFSEPVAKQMAVGAAKSANADCAISVTGIAGPDGGSKDKPVGTVYIGYYYQGDVKVVRYQFEGDRESIREQTVAASIEGMLEMING